VIDRRRAIAHPRPDGRIGPELDRRLRASGPDDRLRVVLLVAAPAGAVARRRHRRADTGARIQAAARDLLPAVDSLLTAHGGERLSAEATVLGTLAVETTPAGVQALARLPAVEAVLGDQELVPVR
jgi:hypothetical protein